MVVRSRLRDFAGAPPAFEARPYDLMFCGHLDDDRKGALFFVDVVRGCIARGFTPSVRVTGDGPLRGEVEARLRAAGVEAVRRLSAARGA